MQKEIGSNFWISPSDLKAEIKGQLLPEIFGCSGTDYIWLSSCRSAISVVIETIEKRQPNVSKVVCLPSFTCNTVYEPFIKSGYNVVLLPINKDLVISSEEIIEFTEKFNVGIILLHNFFGFDTLANIDKVISVLRKKNLYIIEDCTQSMYSDFGRLDADFYVGSIRKWCGVPDGGFAVCKNGCFEKKPRISDVVLEKLKLEASIKKYEYIYNNKGDKDEFLLKYKEAEDWLDNQVRQYNISTSSIKIQSSLDVVSLKSKRRRNYRILLEGIKGINGISPIFKEISDNVVPLYFPLYCDCRERIQKELRDNRIYAPIIWPKNDNCPTVRGDAEYIYNHILCIPIDQRYDSDDMNRIVNILKSHELWTGWMTWDEILPFKELIIDSELEIMIKYHYPDKSISRSYPESRVNNLRLYLNEGNTFFWGAVEKGKLLGYYWGYVSEFLGEKRWNTRSNYVFEDARERGIGIKSYQAALLKAKELKCTEAVSMYAPFNSISAHIYKKLGYEISRIEVVKKL